MSEESQGYYAQFATGMSILLAASGLAILGLVLACMILSLYVAAYGFPLIGAFMLLLGFIVLFSGHVGAFFQALFLATVFIGIGSLIYHGFFLVWHSDLPKLTELPSYVSKTIDGFITHPDE